MEPLATHQIVEEFEGADLGDARRTDRLLRIVDAIARQPDKSFPQMAAGEAELEALYRLLNNPAVNFDRVLLPHRRRTAERAEQAGEVVVVHDTTAFKLAHADPKVVGFLQTGRPGFYGHVSLVVSADGERRPLGVAAVQTIHRKSRSGRGSRKVSRSGSVTTKQPDRESKRWDVGIEQSEALLESCAGVIHVADREADSYMLLAHLVRNESRFVVRVRHDRVARDVEPEAPWSKLKELVGGADDCMVREVPLSARRRTSTAPVQARRYPKRNKRIATLHFATTQIEVRRPNYLRDPWPESLRLNIVRVHEVDAPNDQEPVEWLLVTTEPVKTKEQIERVVDLYRTRWVIEEFFKALKSGCLYQKRQLEGRRALLNALALFLPVACQMLWLRSRAQHAPDTPASEVLSARQIRLLREVSTKQLPMSPTVREVLLAIAALGGHIANNGEPGWCTIWRGFERLLDFELGWIAARKKRNL
jgi:IS4 transposase